MKNVCSNFYVVLNSDFGYPTPKVVYIYGIPSDLKQEFTTSEEYLMDRVRKKHPKINNKSILENAVIH